VVRASDFSSHRFPVDFIHYYLTEMNFDDSSKAWRLNKVPGPNGTFSYKCQICPKECHVYSIKNKVHSGVALYCKKHLSY
jgi:hypothetical protein